MGTGALHACAPTPKLDFQGTGLYSAPTRKNVESLEKEIEMHAEIADYKVATYSK